MDQGGTRRGRNKKNNQVQANKKDMIEKNERGSPNENKSINYLQVNEKKELVNAKPVESIREIFERQAFKKDNKGKEGSNVKHQADRKKIKLILGQKRKKSTLIITSVMDGKVELTRSFSSQEYSGQS